MEINRKTSRLPNWNLLKKWANFQDLELFRISKTSHFFVILILTTESIQRLSLISINFPLDSKLNRIHQFFYIEILPALSLSSPIKDFKELTTISIGVYMLLKFLLTIYFFYIAQRIKVLRNKAAKTLRILEFFKFMDITIFLIPIFRDCFTNLIFFEKWYLCLISTGTLIILILEIFYLSIFTMDLRFIKRNLYQTRDRFAQFLRFFALLLLTSLKTVDTEKIKSEEFSILINFLNFALGIWIILDFEAKLHYMQLPKIRAVYIITNLFYTVESIFSIVFFFYPGFIKRFDMDYMTIIVFVLIINYSLIAARNKEASICQKFVYSLESPMEADQYMENLACLFKKTREKHSKLELFSLLKAHFEKCKDLRCLCFMLKYPLKRSKQRRLIEHLTKFHKGSHTKKLILYEDLVAMGKLRKEHEKVKEVKDETGGLNDQNSDFGENGEIHDEHVEGFYLVDLKSKDLPTVFASFYHILISNLMKKNPFLLFNSYLSFLVFEVNNYVGTLISAYNYIFSLEYERHGGFLKNIKILNFIDISSKRLHKQFTESPYWLSSCSLHKIFNFTERVDNLEKKFSELINLNFNFYQEMSLASINFNFVLETGQKIAKTKKALKEEFDSLFEISKANSKLLSLYINYKLNIEFEEEEYLDDCYEKLNLLYKNSGYKTMQELTSRGPEGLNPFNSQNMLVFVNILKSKFFVSKFTSNTPSFFGMDAKELTGRSLNDLMPSEISQNHDRYVLDYVNQKKYPIIKTASLTSFACTKSGDLKIVSVIVKVEYLMTDDVYLCGIIVPHPRNREVLILSNLSGKIIGMNKKARKLLGTMIIDNPYSLFISIPLLVKYFYPEVEKQLRYSKFSLRRDRKDIIGDEQEEEIDKYGLNFQLETEEFGAFFFKYLLKDNVKFKGILQDSKCGILKNFGFDDLKQWNILREISSKMLLPKHLRILSRVIAKNRELVKHHSDEILTTYVTIDTYKNRENLTLKLVGLHGIKPTNQKVKEFFVHAAQKLKGEMADVFMVAPKDVNNLYKILKVERLIKLNTTGESQKSFLIDNSEIAGHSNSPDQIKRKKLKNSPKVVISEPKKKLTKKKRKKKKHREEDLLDDIGDDSIAINPQDYHFDKNFVVNRGKVVESMISNQNDNKKHHFYKKPKQSLGPRGSALNRSGHRRLSFMTKEKVIFPQAGSGSYNSSNNHYLDKSEKTENDQENEKIQESKKSKKNLNMRIPTIKVNGPEGGEPEGQNSPGFDENPPNFKFIQSQKSVESRLDYLSKIYTNLINVSQTQEILNSVKKVMDIDKLMEIESKAQNEDPDSEEQMKELIIKIESEEEEEEEKIRITRSLKNQTKPGSTPSKDNLLRSSIASIQSRILANNVVEECIKNRMKGIFSKTLSFIKLFLFGILIFTTIIIRTGVKAKIDEHIYKVLELKQLSHGIGPIGYLYKDLTKFELFQEKYLNHDETGEIFEIGILEKLSGDLTNHFGYLLKNNINGITSFDYTLQKQEALGNMSFFILYVHIINDFKLILENYDSEKNTIGENFRLDLNNSRKNSFEMGFKSSVNFDGILNDYKQLREDYSAYYLIFLGGNFILTVCIAIILFILNMKSSQRIDLMSNFLLKVDKIRLRFYYERFYRIKNSLSMISKKRFLTRTSNNNKEISSMLRMKRKEGNRDQSSKRRKNFSVFVGKTHTNGLLVCLIIFSTLIFVNIPVGIDYFLMTRTVNEAVNLNSISVKANLMGGEVYGFYGVFYEKILKKFKGENIDSEVMEMDQKLINIYQMRDELQNLISGYEEFDKFQEMSICDFSPSSENFNNLCRSVTFNQNKYNIFLALSDIVNFRETSMATVVSSKSIKISTLDFMKFDRSLYFIEKSLEEMMRIANEKISTKLNEEKIIQVLFFSLFGMFIGIYYWVYQRVLTRKKIEVVEKLGCCFSVLPPQIIRNNSYLINYFKLRSHYGYM